MCVHRVSNSGQRTSKAAVPDDFPFLYPVCLAISPPPKRKKKKKKKRDCYTAHLLQIHKLYYYVLYSKIFLLLFLFLFFFFTIFRFFWNKPTAGQQPVAYNLRHSPQNSLFCILFCLVGDELMATSFLVLFSFIVLVSHRLPFRCSYSAQVWKTAGKETDTHCKQS